MTELPSRPRAIFSGSVILAVAAALLAVEWVAMADAVVSNGARVFFIALWGWLAVSAYQGFGLVRGTIIAVWVVTVWGGVNAPSLEAMLAATTPGEWAGKVLALAALVLFLLPNSTAWFRAVHAMRTQEEPADARG